MGIDIGLSIVPNKIDCITWQRVYEESLILLKAYPFAGLRTIKKEGKEMLVYTGELEHKLDDFHNRYWLVCGDLKTKKMAETFRLCFDLSNYCGHLVENKETKASDMEKDAENIDDILLELQKEMKDQNSALVNVFFEKTQGAPFHNYLLALAMLFESRLAPFAVVRGSITREQAQIAKEWADCLLKEPIDIPVLLDPANLHSRMSGAAQGFELVDVLNLLWHGDEQEIFDFSLQNFGIDLMENWLAFQLKNLDNGFTKGMLDYLILWLNSTKDLKRLCSLVCLKDDGPKHSPTDFCTALVWTWLFVPNEKYAFLKHLDLKSGSSWTAETLFIDTMLSLQYTGRKMQYFIPMHDVYLPLEKAFPEEAGHLIQLLEREQVKVEERITQTREKVQQLLSDRETGGIQGNDFESIETISLNYDADRPLTEDQLAVISGIADLFKNTLEIFGDADILKKGAESLGWLQMIRNATAEATFILTEEAWEWIEREKNEKLLKILLLSIFLKTLPGFDLVKHFCQGLFENRAFAVQIMNLIDESD